MSPVSLFSHTSPLNHILNQAQLITSWIMSLNCAWNLYCVFHWPVWAKKPKRDITLLRAELRNNNTILKLFVGTEYVYKMYVGIYIKRKFGMNAARCTLVESVTLTGMLQWHAIYCQYTVHGRLQWYKRDIFIYIYWQSYVLTIG